MLVATVFRALAAVAAAGVAGAVVDGEELLPLLPHAAAVTPTTHASTIPDRARRQTRAIITVSSVRPDGSRPPPAALR
jgi:hypothetical protein